MSNTSILIIFFLVIALLVLIPIFLFGYLPPILRKRHMAKLAHNLGLNFVPNDKEPLTASGTHSFSLRTLWTFYWKQVYSAMDHNGRYPVVKRNIISGTLNGHIVEVFDSYQRIYGPMASAWSNAKNTDYYERRTVITIDGQDKILSGISPLNFISIKRIGLELFALKS